MPLLEFERVTKRFRGMSRIALDDVSLSVEPGEFVAVWGSSRSGKTTLLRLAAGVLTPDSGSVRFDGEDLAQLTSRARTRLRRIDVGCAWPSVMLSPRLPVLERVATPLLGDRSGRQARGAALDALRLVGADALASASWDDLPDGDRARVAIAQALVRRPRLLLADEPTVNLDMVEREHILGVLRAAASEHRTAVLITAPDAPDTLRSDRTLSLADGELIEPPRQEPAKVIPLRDHGARTHEAR